jgi:hypothetical protein
MYALLIVVCPFVFFNLTIVLSGLPRYTDSDYPFGIFKLFFQFSRGEGRVWILPIEHRHIFVNPNVHIFKGQNSKKQCCEASSSISNLTFIWVSEWLLFNANSAMFQLYHGENKLIFNELMVRSTLY